jgi:hypothetical protein
MVEMDDMSLFVPLMFFKNKGSCGGHFLMGHVLGLAYQAQQRLT